MKINIIEELKTVYGKILIVNNNYSFRVGDVIETTNGEKYKIKGIMMPTNPNHVDNIFLIV